MIVDPSHATGDRRLVEPLARAAAAVGADGIIVEVHNDPEAALCDGAAGALRARLPGLRPRVAAHAALDGKEIGLGSLSAAPLRIAELASRVRILRSVFWVPSFASIA